MTERDITMPPPTLERTYYCNQCGHMGPVGESHPLPDGSGLCSYYACSSGPYWDEAAVRAAILADRELSAALAEPSTTAAPCPLPIGDDDGTAKQCIDRGHCGCDSQASAAVLADRAAAQPIGMRPKELVERVKRGEKWEVQPAAPAEPRVRLSCGCASDYHGFPSEWDGETRDCQPCTVYGQLCERHFTEYNARPAAPLRDEAWIAEAMRLADEYAYYAVEAYWRNNDEYRKVRDEDRAALEGHLRGKAC